MADVVSINKRVEEATERLLEQHQAIIDAWYAEWIEEERARIDAAFRRGSDVTNGEL